ncbi:hypothetical protein CPT_Madawaska_203 [Staphylococcus phage Madawaska]|nr:hypothetical protein CPT_Madawaska_203 [Staphylococcus phage Madawaska]
MSNENKDLFVFQEGLNEITDDMEFVESEEEKRKRKKKEEEKAKRKGDNK